jgi:hypothetical protein
MMQRSDPPLKLVLPSCEVLLFPVTKRVGKIRHTAQLLAGKHGEDADLYWKQVTASMRRSLDRIGMQPNTVQEELRGFHFAVQAEMTRQSLQNRGGAA